MKVLLFDVDGTLVKAGGAGRRALNEAAYSLYGKKNTVAETSLAGRTDHWNFKTTYRNATGKAAKAKDIEELGREYLKRLPYYVRRAVAEGGYHVPEGLPELIRALHGRRDVALALGTGNVERGARIKLAPSGLNYYFPFGGFGTDGVHRVQMLRKARTLAQKRLGLKIAAKDVYVIGDTPFDVAAGREAGFKTAAVATGYAPWNDLVEARPDFLARDFREVKKWLKWFGIE